MRKLKTFYGTVIEFGYSFILGGSSSIPDFPIKLESYEKPASVSSVFSDTSAVTGVASNMSPHYYYILHFPIPKDGYSSHELNQRAILLYGVGQAREQVRVTTKQIIKETGKLFGKKHCSNIDEGRRPSRTATHAGLKERFLQLSYFDRNVVSEAAVKALIKRLASLFTGECFFLIANCFFVTIWFLAFILFISRREMSLDFEERNEFRFRQFSEGFIGKGVACMQKPSMYNYWYPFD